MPVIHDNHERFLKFKESRTDRLNCTYMNQSVECKHEPGYILFTVQNPNDMAVRLHGNGMSVMEALEKTVVYCQERGKRLIIRGHPRNMEWNLDYMKRFPESQGHVWDNSTNINVLLKNCEMLVTLGSGSGLDAIFHEKPVVIFGRADYESVVNRVTDLNNYKDVLDNAAVNVQDYRNFLRNILTNISTVITVLIPNGSNN